jgi:hypothetical protein
MCLHAEVLILAHFCLLHVCIAFTALVLHPGRRDLGGRAYESAFCEYQSLRGQLVIAGIGDIFIRWQRLASFLL